MAGDLILPDRHEPSKGQGNDGGDGRIELGKLSGVIARYRREHGMPTVAPRALLQAPIFHDERFAAKNQVWAFEWEHREGGRRESRAVETINHINPNFRQPVIDQKTGRQKYSDDGTPLFRPSRGDRSGLLRWLDLDVSMAVSYECVRRGTQRISIEERLIFGWLGYRDLVTPPLESLRASIMRLTETRIAFYDPTIGKEDPDTVERMSILSRSFVPPKSETGKRSRNAELDVSLSDEWIIAITEGDRQVVDLRPYFHLVRRLRQAEGVERSDDDEAIPNIARSILLFLASLRRDKISELPLDWLQTRFGERVRVKGVEYQRYADALNPKGRIRRSLDTLGRLGILTTLDQRGDKIICTWGDARGLDAIPHLIQDPQRRLFSVDWLTGEVAGHVELPEIMPEANNHDASPAVNDQRRRLIDLVERSNGDKAAEELVVRAARRAKETGLGVWESLSIELPGVIGESGAEVILLRVFAQKSKEVDSPGNSGWSSLIEDLTGQIPTLTSKAIERWRKDWDDASLVAMMVEVISEKADVESRGFTLAQRAGLYAKSPEDERWKSLFKDEQWCKALAKLCKDNKIEQPVELTTKLTEFSRKRSIEIERKLRARAEAEKIEKEQADERARKAKEERERAMEIFKSEISPCLDYWEIHENRQDAIKALMAHPQALSWIQGITNREVGVLREVFRVLYDKELVEERFYPFQNNHPPKKQ